MSDGTQQTHKITTLRTALQTRCRHSFLRRDLSVEVGDHGTAITLDVCAPLRLPNMGDLARGRLHAWSGVQGCVKPTVSCNLLRGHTGAIEARFGGQLGEQRSVVLEHDCSRTVLTETTPFGVGPVVSHGGPASPSRQPTRVNRIRRRRQSDRRPRAGRPSIALRGAYEPARRRRVTEGPEVAPASIPAVRRRHGKASWPSTWSSATLLPRRIVRR